MDTKNTQDSVVSELYDGYVDTQKEILDIETRKTRNKLFTVAAVIFAFDLLAILAANVITTETIILISVIPLIMIGLAFLSMKEPLLVMIIAALIITALWIYVAVATKGEAAISGWLGKAVIAYLIIAGFQNAKEANKIRRELKNH